MSLKLLSLAHTKMSSKQRVAIWLHQLDTIQDDDLETDVVMNSITSSETTSVSSFLDISELEATSESGSEAESTSSSSGSSSSSSTRDSYSSICTKDAMDGVARWLQGVASVPSQGLTTVVIDSIAGILSVVVTNRTMLLPFFSGCRQ